MKTMKRSAVAAIAVSLILLAISAAFAAAITVSEQKSTQKSYEDLLKEYKIATETPADKTSGAATKPVEGTGKTAAEPAPAEPEKPAVKSVDFGQDGNKMQWYLVNYGKKDGVPFASVRKYYTNPTERQKTVELLMSKYNLSKEAADKLYFTEYGYVYSQDAKKFAVTYLNHYDMEGKFVKATENDPKSLEYITMTKGMIALRALPYAEGKSGQKPAAKTTAKTATKTSAKTSAKTAVKSK